MAEPLIDRVRRSTTLPIWLTCPQCAYTWHAATLDPAYDEIKVATIAKQVYCRVCQRAPPMVIAEMPVPPAPPVSG